MKKLIWSICFFYTFVFAEHTLTMAVSEHIGALNPQGYQGNAMFAQNAVYEGLTRINKKGEVVPSLALSWEIKDGGKLYEFSLRKDVLFHNGESFNADAVVKNFQSILKNRARHSWSGLMNALDSVSKIDEYKVSLKLKYPYAPTLNELSTPRPFRFLAPSAFPSDLDLIRHNPKPIGTGVYMLVDSKLGVSDTLARNPHHWDTTHKAYYERVVCKVIYDPNAKLAALRSGQIDIIYGEDQIPFEIFKSMQNNPRFHTYMSEPIFVTNLVLNSSSRALTLDSPLDSANLRKFVALAIDTQRITKAVYGDMQTQSKIFMRGAKALEAIKIERGQLKENIQALIESQRENREKKQLELLFSGDNPAQKMMAEIIQSDLAQVGLSVRLNACEPTICRNRMLKGAFDMAFSDTWGAPYEPLSLLYSMLIPSHIDYAAQLGLPQKGEIDKNIREIIATLPDSQQAHILLDKILTTLAQSGIYIPLVAQRNKAIAHQKIKGIEMGITSYEVPFWEFYE